jgi:hypothetical protein
MPDRYTEGRWTYSIAKVFCRKHFPSVEAAKLAALEVL